MSAVGDAFTKAFGKPDPAMPNGVLFSQEAEQDFWISLHSEIGSGWFRDGFVYLFGEGLADLGTCLEAWSFLVPPNENRLIVGKNAYGAILVVDDAGIPYKERVYVLDPFSISYTTDPNLRFVNLIGRWLPRNELRGFLDDAAYRAWRDENKAGRLDFDDVLGIKVPRPLGGKLEAGNLQIDGIVDYYKTTAPIYADAIANAKPSAAARPEGHNES